MAEFRKADPRARRQAVLIVAVGGLLGAALLLAFERYKAPLLDWGAGDARDPASRARAVLAALAAAVVLPLFGFCGYLWSLAQRAVRSREFPPPGVRVVRDTEILTGSAAVSRARLLQALALALTFAALVLLAVFWRLAAAILTLSSWSVRG